MMVGQASNMLDLQETAEVRHMVLSAVLTMLPVLTYGALGSSLISQSDCLNCSSRTQQE